jgi:16S rRNA (cytosine1402-N4)-methyltransferase
MADEVIEALAPRPHARGVDGTLGDGGHAERILTSTPTLELLAVDRDEQALSRARARLAAFAERVRFEHAAFGELPALLERAGWTDGVDGLLLDLGVSSLQLDAAERGFSFRHAAPLDMRMDRAHGPTAADLLANRVRRDC